MHLELLAVDPTPAPGRRSLLTPAVIRVLLQQAWIPKQQDEHGTRDESTDVGPKRDAAALSAYRPESADDLNEEPVPEHEYRGYRDGGYEEA